MKALVFIPLLVMGLNIGGSAQTTINLPAAQNCAPTGAADTDSDGIPDSRDACPSVAGVWALNGCPVPAGTSGQAYKWECDHAGTAIVDVTLSDGSVWMDRNLGALRAATDEIDLMAGGCLYQYGRRADGHQSTIYYQPKNWLNGYPTADNVLGNSVDKIGEPQYNGYFISPMLGKRLDNSESEMTYINSLALEPYFVNSSFYPSGVTYNETLNSAGTVLPDDPLTVQSPGVRTSTRQGRGTTNYTTWFWWNVDNPSYPISYVDKLWGGTAYSASSDETTTTLVQPWGQEKNPVCPTGYHVPLAAEWISALQSIKNTDNYAGSWGKSKLKLVVPFGAPIGSGTAYWTSTTQETQFVYTVSFIPNTIYGDMDDISVGTVMINNPIAQSKWQMFSGSLYVRCKKN